MTKKPVSKTIARVRKRIIQFDSCTACMHSLARYIKHKDFGGVGVLEGTPEWVGDAINAVPPVLREKLYSWSGWKDALGSDEIEKLRSEDISRWVVSVYPQKKYPGIMFGSANGAVTHLCAALGIPWLPQTYLVAIRRFLKPDEIIKDILWGRKHIRPFLDKNPDLHAYQMHDPVQDRLMVQKMAYFRIKKSTLGTTFQRFITNNRTSGAPLFTVECTFRWPAFHAGDRHFFQLGGFGATTPYEYLNGSARVQSFLKRVDAPVTGWDTFPPTGEYPEAEWGYLEEVNEDIRAFAKEHKIPLTRILFDHPEDISPFVADLYRWWYKIRGRVSHRLLIENFGLLTPFDAVETTSIPFWLVFNTETSYKFLCQYLDKHKAFKEMYLMLMSNGVTEGLGLTTIEEWQGILQRASERGEFIGVDEREYPMDFATFIRYNNELKAKITDRQPFPEALTLAELREFIDKYGKKYKVAWEQ